MNNDMVSIIVPIYNAGLYISRCIDSILRQTYQNIEIILVDDGSTDDSRVICGRYADSRIHYFYKKNGGLSDARNYGIHKANGTYVCFIDADDCIHTRFIEFLICSAKKADTAIAMCLFDQFFNYDMPKEEIFPEVPEFSVFSSKDLGFLFSSQYYPNITIACNKIFRAELFNTTEFPIGMLHEDEATVYKLLCTAEKFAIIDYKLYYYFSNTKGITKSKYKKERLVYIDIMIERLEFAIRNGNFEFAKTTIKQLYYYYVDLLQKEPEEIQDYTVVHEVLKKQFSRLKVIFRSKYARIDIKLVTILSNNYSSYIMRGHVWLIKLLLKIRR